MRRIDESRQIVHKVFIICHQIHQEAFEYYFSHNAFLLTLVSPYYNLQDMRPEWTKLLKRLRHIQRLHVVIYTSQEQRHGLDDGSDESVYRFRHDSQFPKQQEQWDCMVYLLLKSHEGSGGRQMKELCLIDWAGLQPDSLALDADIPVYASLLQSLKGRVAQCSVIGGPLYTRVVLS